MDKRAEARGEELGRNEEYEEKDEQVAKCVIAEGRRSSGGTVALSSQQDMLLPWKRLDLPLLRVDFYLACGSELHGLFADHAGHEQAQSSTWQSPRVE